MAIDPVALLALLRDPNAESRQIAEAAGVAREEAGRAARLVHAIARAKPEEVATLPAALGLALLHAALEAGRTELVASLAAGPNREVAKEAKRALHRLRTRGVSVPELPRVAPPSSPAPAEPEMPCYGSTPDGHGEQAIWIARVVPGKGVEVAQAVLSDETGLVSLQVGFLGRKEYRTFAQELLAKGGKLGVAEIARDRALSAVAEAARLTQATGRPLPEGASSWLARLGPAQPLADPAERFAPLEPQEERLALAASGELHELPLFRGWLAEEEALRAAAARLDAVAASPILLDEQQRQEQAGRVVREAIAAYFDDGRRARWAHRLFLSAVHLDEAGETLLASRAAAAARALLAGRDPLDIPFARMLFEKALSPAPGPAPSARPEPPRAPLILSAS